MTTKRDYQTVPSVEVARYYLKSELGHMLPSVNAGNVLADIDSKSDEEIASLCEALATHYRLNGVWWVIADRNFTWSCESVRIHKVRLTGMGDGTAITKLIYSKEIKNDPVRLRKKLASYYSNFPDGPDQYLVKPTNARINLPRLIIVEYKNELRLLDGSHRFIEQLLAGKNEVQAYVARSDTQPAKIRGLAGEGTFRILARLFKDVDQPKRDDIYKVAGYLAEEVGKPEFLKAFDDILKKESQNDEA